MSIGVVGFNFGHGSVVFLAFDNDVLYFPSACALFGGDVAEAYAYFLACVGAEVDGGSLGVECPALACGESYKGTGVATGAVTARVRDIGVRREKVSLSDASVPPVKS